MTFTKETWRRALRTLAQVAVSYIAANLCIVDFSAEGEVLKSALVGLVVSALAAGIAAVMNMQKSESTEETDEEISEVEDVAE